MLQFSSWVLVGRENRDICNCMWVCTLPCSMLSHKLLLLLSAIQYMPLSWWPHLQAVEQCTVQTPGTTKLVIKKLRRCRGATILATGEQPAMHYHRPVGGTQGWDTCTSRTGRQLRAPGWGSGRNRRRVCHPELSWELTPAQAPRSPQQRGSGHRGMLNPG